MSTPTSQDLLKVEQVAHRLNISRTKVYDLMNSGQLRFVKIDRLCRIPSSEVDALIARKLQGGDDA